MQSRVKWVENMTFVGQSSSGHSIVLDGNGGEKAPSPMELVLMAAGGVVRLMLSVDCRIYSSRSLLVRSISLLSVVNRHHEFSPVQIYTLSLPVML